MGRAMFVILKLTRDAVQPQNKTDFCSNHNKAIRHLGLWYGIFMMVCYIFSITSFHFTSTLDLGDISKRALVWWELYLLTSLREPTLTPSSQLEVILLLTERCQDVFGDWPHWALLQCLWVWCFGPNEVTVSILLFTVCFQNHWLVSGERKMKSEELCQMGSITLFSGSGSILHAHLRECCH